MSKIQKQVIFHVKKSLQNFSLDYGLNRLSFFKYRRYNLRDNFLRLCYNNRRRVRKQIGFLLQRRFKVARRLSVSLKSYSAFFLTYISKYFRNNTHKLYDVNTFFYIYFLNRLFFYINSFLVNFPFFTEKGLLNLNVFFNLVHLLYPGVVYKNLVYRLWYQTVFSKFNNYKSNNNTCDYLNYSIIYFLRTSWLLSKKYLNACSNASFILQKIAGKCVTTDFSWRNVNYSNSTLFSNKRSFKKINLNDLF